MASGFSFTDNSQMFKDEVARRAERALVAVGQQAVGHCKQELENTPKRIDTGLLRNSITFAVGGQAPELKSYSGDKPRNGSIPTGSYSGTAPEEDKPVVYVGTNVEYAPYVEYGTDRMAPNHFIKNGIQNNADELLAIMKHFFEG